MITPEDILNLNFYKKEKFTGSAGVNAGTADSCVCSKARRTE